MAFYRSKFFNIIIRSSEGSKTDFLGESCELRVSKEWDMAQEFVAYIPDGVKKYEIRHTKCVIVN